MNKTNNYQCPHIIYQPDKPREFLYLMGHIESFLIFVQYPYIMTPKPKLLCHLKRHRYFSGSYDNKLFSLQIIKHHIKLIYCIETINLK